MSAALTAAPMAPAAGVAGVAAEPDLFRPRSPASALSPEHPRSHTCRHLESPLLRCCASEGVLRHTPGTAPAAVGGPARFSSLGSPLPSLQRPASSTGASASRGPFGRQNSQLPSFRHIFRDIITPEAEQRSGRSSEGAGAFRRRCFELTLGLSSSGGRRPRSVTSVKSGGLLSSGLSPSMEEQNALQDRCLIEWNAERGDRRSLGGDAMNVPPSLGVDSEQDFLRLTAGVSTSIDDLRKRHDSFEPTNAIKAESPSRKSKVEFWQKQGRSSAMGSDEEEDERRRERLEYYKMFRRVEPELSPLTASLTIPPQSKAVGRDQAIVHWNCSMEANHRWCPEERKLHRIQSKTRREARQVEVAAQREFLIAFNSSSWSQVLSRKRSQGELAVSLRRQGGAGTRARPSPHAVRALAEKWSTFYVVFVFASRMQQEVSLRKMGREERMLYVAQYAKGGLQSDFAIKAAQISNLLKDPVLVRKLEMMTAMFQRIHAVRQRRHQAEIVVACLRRVAGQCATSFLRGRVRFFVLRVIKLQQWWRVCSKQLKEMRDRISKRWERLERAELVRELNKAEPIPKNMGSAPVPKIVPKPKLCLEDKIRLETVDEAVRLRFIEHELRAKRYFLLPAIKIWQDDAEKWRRDMQEWRENRGVLRTLGHDTADAAGATLTFGWPPCRPSYMPPAHLPSEKQGGPCGEGCLGRKGDAEILRMLRLAKAHPEGGGWKEIPIPRARHPCVDGDSPSGSAAVAAAAAAAPGSRRSLSSAAAAAQKQSPEEKSETSRLFGEATADDLRRWNIDPGAMPGFRPAGLSAAAGAAAGGAEDEGECDRCWLTLWADTQG